MVVLAVLVALPYVIPGADRFRVLTALPEGSALWAPSGEREPPVGEVDVPPPSLLATAQPERVEPPSRAGAIAAPPVAGERAPVPIIDPNGHALDTFYGALTAIEGGRGDTLVRIGFWGDSNVASDLVTSWLRRKLQGRFGDGGHGFVLPANSDEYYVHNDVERSASTGWRVSRIVGPLAVDGLYGLGGASFRSRWSADFVRVATSDRGAVGGKVSHFGIHYLAHPEGPEVDVIVDGKAQEVIDSRADGARGMVRVVDVADGPHQLELRPRRAGLRLFGMWLERDGPGVVLDALGLAGAKVRYLSRIERTHFHQQLAFRSPHLWVLNYGVNAGQEGLQFPMADYQRTMIEVIRSMQEALPEASCLIVSPNDLAWKTPQGDYLSKQIVADLGATQRAVAAICGCAFWDLYQAMGGSGSMGRWIDRELARPDMLHPTAAGAELLARWLYLALMEGLASYQLRSAPSVDGGQN
jgi:lysophospholipase L1-like esterase